MNALRNLKNKLTLKEYNESRLNSSEILSGKEYRRKLRKVKNLN